MPSLVATLAATLAVAGVPDYSGLDFTGAFPPPSVYAPLYAPAPTARPDYSDLDFTIPLPPADTWRHLFERD